ncbi:MAG: response regulator [Elusimicrobia bacterium]|nr:response regulator [Candidatus Liberimonas magnetica]
MDTKKPKILVVDDNDDIRAACIASLRNEGYILSQASSGEIAVRMLDMSQYDIVLTDYQMGDISGLDVLKKAKETCPECWVIMMTAFSSQELAREVLRNYEGTSFLCKPLNVAALRENIKLCLDRKNSKQIFKDAKNIIKDVKADSKQQL